LPGRKSSGEIMIRLFGALCALVLVAGAAVAADDVMANLYGNTVVSTGGVAEIHTHYRADHSFDMVASRMGMSRTFKGTWAIDGKGTLCRTFVGDAPPDTPNPLCIQFAPHKVGDTWTLQINGSSRTMTLKAGVE
jgi:hypothetical protein